MKKVIKFAGKGAYESPCCEVLSVQAKGAVLTGSGDFNDYGLKDLSEESGSVINQSDDWN
ncbi:MAG: hypothetical protein ACI3ZF_00810 [Candidatus Cryptobacteroides sp.]